MMHVEIRDSLTAHPITFFESDSAKELYDYARRSLRAAANGMGQPSAVSVVHGCTDASGPVVLMLGYRMLAILRSGPAEHAGEDIRRAIRERLV